LHLFAWAGEFFVHINVSPTSGNWTPLTPIDLPAMNAESNPSRTESELLWQGMAITPKRHAFRTQQGHGVIVNH